ncbi:hypothetical protein [Nostoc sp. ChiVER01]|uniref:hypothetical protein n=1 Tax=Nostoc sp. ChiVER01 TaxID=3075382 RepID=UPI002AD3BCFE|nr:hypothetical protein [Nostoc sp. ChiVER01]MDZ8224989.1 hypothetical protein [Nostoc sp. ChiVER01]
MATIRKFLVGLGTSTLFFILTNSKFAYGETITFNDVVNPNPGRNASFKTLKVDNFIFDAQGAFGVVDLVFEPKNCDCVPGDSPYLAAGGSGRTISIRNADNALFSIPSIDASKIVGFGSNNDITSPQIVIRGLKNDNSQVSTFFNLENKFQTFLLPEIFNNLQSVTFSGVIRKNFDDNLAIDNIVLSVASIPEPTSTASLLAIGTLEALLTLKRGLKQKIK